MSVVMNCRMRIICFKSASRMKEVPIYIKISVQGVPVFNYGYYLPQIIFTV